MFYDSADKDKLSDICKFFIGLFHFYSKEEKLILPVRVAVWAVSFLP